VPPRPSAETTTVDAAMMRKAYPKPPEDGFVLTATAESAMTQKGGK
jgi:hypothetical protein